MKFMFQYPEVNGSDRNLLDSGSVGDVAIAVERAGWSGLAFTEHPAPTSRWLHAGGHQTLDPLIALAGAATVTSKIRLLTYLAVFPYRNPMLLAKAAASVDLLSNGRLILGAGTGYLKGEFRALGVDFAERNDLFDETLDVLPLHWSGEPFDYEGKHFSARDVLALPHPVQQPIPVWLGGNAKITLSRVAERCQGWMPLMGPDEMFTTTRTPSPGSPSEMALKISQLKKDAETRDVELDFALPYMDPSIMQPLADVERHREEFGRLAECGATWCVIPAGAAPPAQTLDFISQFAETYIQP
jgi:probable F420-dependent oxidoreductase